MRTGSLIAALVAALPLAAHADGDVIIDINANSGDLGYGLVEGPGGRLYFTGFENLAFSLLAVDSSGRRIASFGTNGRVTNSNVSMRSVGVRSDGSVVVGYSGGAIYDATGVLVNTFQDCPGCIDSILPLADGRVYFGGTAQDMRGFPQGGTLSRLTANGQLDTTYGGSWGPGVERLEIGPINHVATLQPLPNGQFIALGYHETTPSTSLGRFNSDGLRDFTFGTNGSIGISSLAPFYTTARPVLGIDHSQRMLVPGTNNLLIRRNADGTVDGTYTGAAPIAGNGYFGFVLDSQDRAVVFGLQGAQVYVARLLANGGFDNTFGTGGAALVSLHDPQAESIASLRGIVDSSDRPVFMVAYQRTDFGRDLALMRLTAAGAPDVSFGAGVTDDDPYVNAFTIASKSAPYGTSAVMSDAITPTGFNVPTSLSLSGPLHSNVALVIGCNNFVSYTTTVIQPGQSICLQVGAPATPGATNTLTLRVGGQTATFSVTATAAQADITPDPFTFAAQANVDPNSLITSAPVTIQGIAGFAPIAVSGGEYSIECQSGSWTRTDGTVIAGQHVCLRVAASASFSTSSSATLAVNGVTGTFTVTTAAAPPAPPPAPPPGGGGGGGGGGYGGGGGALGGLELLGLGLLGVLRALLVRARTRGRLLSLNAYSSSSGTR